MNDFRFKTNRGGFTLMETVIAIGVLAVLLTAFMSVFGPAAQGIKKAISVQEADRLTATVEKELVTVRSGGTDSFDTGFDKAYDWIENSNNAQDALLVYQYRGSLSGGTRSDGTMNPYQTSGGVAGQDYVVVPMVRRKGDSLLAEDLEALEGRVYLVRLTQLIFSGGTWEMGTPGSITPPPNSSGGGGGSGPDGYPEAVIPCVAEFFSTPNSSLEYLTSARLNPANMKSPMFTRNIAVRR